MLDLFLLDPDVLFLNHGSYGACPRPVYREHRIEVLAQDWRGQPTLRVSFQGYNDESDLDALLSALASELC